MQTKVITDVPMSESDNVNFLTDDGGTLKKMKMHKIIENAVHKISDPDQYPLNTEENTIPSPNKIVPAMEVGGLSKSSGNVSERSDSVRTADFIPVSGGVYTFRNGRGYKMCVICYDSEQVILPPWYENAYSYAYVPDGCELELPLEAAYLKFYCSNTSDVNVTFTITEGSSVVPVKKVVEFVKQYFAKGDYSFECTEMDVGQWQLELKSKNDEFAIMVIKPPKSKPHEATLALSLRGDKTIQFADFSCMRYDETARGSVEIVMQKRGDTTPLPYFCIAFNDGEGAGRIRKLTVNPDAKPIRMTADGLEVRRSNTYDNEWTDEDTVVIDLAALNDKVEKIYAALIANGMIVEAV